MDVIVCQLGLLNSRHRLSGCMRYCTWQVCASLSAWQHLPCLLFFLADGMVCEEDSLLSPGLGRS